MVVQGRRRCRHPGIGSIHGVTLLPPEVHSLTCFLICDVDAAGVTSPSGTEQPCWGPVTASHTLSTSSLPMQILSRPLFSCAFSVCQPLTQRAPLAPFSLSAAPKMLSSASPPRIFYQPHWLLLSQDPFITKTFL